MERDEIVLKLEENGLEWNNFLHFMSGKQMIVTSNHNVLFPKKEVYNFINNG